MTSPLGYSVPSFNPAQIAFLSDILKKEIEGWIFHACYGEEDQFILLFKQDEREKVLFVSLRKPFLHFCLTKSYKKFRSTDSHPLQQLIGSQLIAVDSVKDDRILKMEMVQEGKKFKIIFEFFLKHPNYYILNDENRILYSLHSSKSEFYSFPSLNQSITTKNERLLSHQEIDELYAKLEKQIEFENEKAQLHRLVNNSVKRLTKKRLQLEEQLKDCLKWQALQHEGELLKSHFAELKKGQTSIVVWDWNLEKEKTISLDPSKTPQELISERFKKSKKLYKGIEFAKDQKERLDLELASLKQKLSFLEQAQSFSQLANLKIDKPLSPDLEKKVKKEQKAKPYFEYESSKGVKIWVGKNAAANEKLTFTLSRGSDWWLHTKDFPGSHVIIKNLKGQEPDPDTLADAMQIALHYSKAKNEKAAEICMTQCKFLSKLGKGQQGKVQISKHRILNVKMDKERFRRLKEKNLEA